MREVQAREMQMRETRVRRRPDDRQTARVRARRTARRKARRKRILRRCEAIFMMGVLCLMVLLGVRWSEKAKSPGGIAGWLSREGSGAYRDGEASAGQGFGGRNPSERERIYETILTCLEGNPELADFAAGFPEAEFVVTGGITEEEKGQDDPLFLQWDARWGYVPFGDSVIGLSGCGPTCMSMVLFCLTRDESATPDALAAYCMERGHYVRGSGTEWAFMTDIPGQYEVTAKEISPDESAMRLLLDEGGRIICSMRPGDFTTTGHFIVIYGYDGEGFLVNDPNSRERSSVSWSFDVLRRQIRNMWGYWK